MSVARLPVHPAAEVLPRMTDEELRALAADIKEQGQRLPVVLVDFRGKRYVLDGRSRIAACALLGVEPTTSVWVGEDPIAFVISANLTRRHLTPGQRAMAACILEGLYRKEAMKRAGGRPKKAAEKPEANLPQVSEAGLADSHGIEPNTGDASGPPLAAVAHATPSKRAMQSRERAAAQLAVSPRLVQQAKTVRSKAVPEIAAAVGAGRVTISDALSVVDEPASAQRELLAKVERGELRSLARARRAGAEGDSGRRSVAKVVSREEAVASPNSFAPPKRTFDTDRPILEEVWQRVIRLSAGAKVLLHHDLGRHLEHLRGATSLTSTSPLRSARGLSTGNPSHEALEEIA